MRPSGMRGARSSQRHLVAKAPSSTVATASVNGSDDSAVIRIGPSRFATNVRWSSRWTSVPCCGQPLADPAAVVTVMQPAPRSAESTTSVGPRSVVAGAGEVLGSLVGAVVSGAAVDSAVVGPSVPVSSSSSRAARRRSRRSPRSRRDRRRSGRASATAARAWERCRGRSWSGSSVTTFAHHRSTWGHSIGRCRCPTRGSGGGSSVWWSGGGDAAVGEGEGEFPVRPQLDDPAVVVDVPVMD